MNALSDDYHFLGSDWRVFLPIISALSISGSNTHLRVRDLGIV